MTVLSDDLEVLKDSFRVIADTDRIVTRAEGRYLPDASGVMAAQVTSVDPTSETALGKQYMEAMEMPWIRHTATAQHVAGRVVSGRHYPLLRVDFAAPVEVATMDLMDTVRVIHYSGPGDGSFDENVIVTDISTDLDAIKTEISAVVAEG